jgi:GTP1/Obg family GTP-binding protein
LKEGEVLQAISSIKDRKVLNQVQGTLSAIRQELTEKAEQNSADLADGLKRIDDLSKGVEDQIGELSKTTTYLNDMQNFYFGGMDSATQLDFQKYRVWIHSDNDTLVRKAMAIAEKYNLNVKMEDASSGLADLKFYGMIACGVILVAFIALVLFMRKGTGTTRTP